MCILIQCSINEPSKYHLSKGSYTQTYPYNSIYMKYPEQGTHKDRQTIHGCQGLKERMANDRNEGKNGE